jgi:chromosome partitioning protein
MEGVTELLRTLERVREGLNPNLAVRGVLLTMVDERTNLGRQVSREVIRFFGDKVYKTAIPRNVKLAEAPSFGKPIIFYDIASRGAQSYLQVAREFLAHEP